MSKKLYVGNLPYEVNSTRLEEIFSEAGSVASADVIMDRYSGRSKGFGFVEMASDEDAEKAISMFDGKEIEGRTVKVNEARPRQPRGGDRY